MGKGYYLTKTKALVILSVFVVIIMAVGLLSGLTSRRTCNSNHRVKQQEPVLFETTESGASTTEAYIWEQGPWIDPFLPESLQPVHYDLWIYPDFYYDGSTYWGQVNITINITQHTNYLIVHIKMMNITETKVLNPQGDPLDVKRTFEYRKNQYWVVETEDAINRGSTIILCLGFSSSLLNGILGLYKSTYTNTKTGKESWLATTMFAPTDARKGFPNFDEPKYKTTFIVTLKHWANFTALSNMPAESISTLDDGFAETTFQKSVPMSSYLLCMVICDFAYKENTLSSGKPHRVWAPPDKIEQVGYALEVGKSVLDWMEQYFQIDYHLPKLDQIAIPDFPFGAMEHWGLVTYRETSLLYDPTQVSAEGKERVAMVVAHELSHNYFGNAVTCNWWENIWLNEGFARFFQYKALTPVHPDWETEVYFALRTQEKAMEVDAGASSRPLVIKVTHPDDINQVFDSITYDKGASMLRMLESIIGPERFRLALTNYLREYEFGSVDTEDLWTSLQESIGSELDISTLMRPWTEQMGLPVVDISIPQEGQITASQKRFLKNPNSNPDKPESEFEYKWYIPLTYMTPTIQQGTQWLNKTALTFADPRQTSREWIKFNVKQAGFYRVNYSPAMWKQLRDALITDHHVFSPVDRLSILNDAFVLASASQLQYQVALDMTKYMSNETAMLPWRGTIYALNYISARLYGNEYYGMWRNYLSILSNTAFLQLGVQEGGGQQDKLLRTDIIRLACNNGNAQCLSDVSQLFNQWLENPLQNALSPSLRLDVYRIGMAEVGTEEAWNIIWDRYLNSTSAQDKLYLLQALACNPRLWLLERYLKYCNDSNKVRTQDFFKCIKYATVKPEGLLFVWNWVRANYDALIERFTTSNLWFGRFVPDIVSKFDTEYQLQEVESFFSKYPDSGSGKRPREQALDAIRSNIEWKNTNEWAIVEWLKDVQ